MEKGDFLQMRSRKGEEEEGRWWGGLVRRGFKKYIYIILKQGLM